MSTISFAVAAEETGERVDVLVARHTGLSRSVAASLDVTVDGAAAAKSLRVEEGQQISATLPDAPMPPQPEAIDVPVAYEDDHLLIVDKPAGLVVHPAPGHDSGTLVNALLARAGKPTGGEEFRAGIVHRLDAGTSGLMVVAKTAETFADLTRMIGAREVHREYIALVEGSPASDSATIDAPIGRSSRHRKRMAVVAEGRAAITHYRVRETFRDTALLDITLETGRTHQIRVHLAEIGHPVVGDNVYGHSRSLARELGLDRPFLHAARLAFTHPVTGAPIEVVTDLPSDLKGALERAKS